MSLADIRGYYKVPAFRGTRVKALQRPGTITGSDGSRIRVRLDGAKRAVAYHPTWCIGYLPAGPEEGKSE